MNSWHDFPGPNAGYVLELYDRYRQNPDSVDAATREFFSAWTPPADERAPGAPGLAIEKIIAATGLAVVVWAYPRGGGLSKEGETALDVTAYAAHIAAQLGAHIIKIKLPTAHIEFEEARKVYEEQHIPRDTLAERVRHVVQGTFNGRRIVIFSGGAKTDDTAILDEARAIRAGGGFGSIIGRNTFQRDRTAALNLLDQMTHIYKGETP
jgi:fructose-bisphosphate aldolase, class I